MKTELRQKFELEVAEKHKGNTISIIFYQKTEDYITWLENSVIEKRKYAIKCSNASLIKASQNVVAYIGSEGTKDTPLVSQKSITNMGNIVLL